MSAAVQPLNKLPRRFMLIETEPATIQLIRLQLKALDAQVVPCYEPKWALQEVRGKPWDLVIVAADLPAARGMDVCRGLRAHSPHVPIIMLTAAAGFNEGLLALECGADDYLVKPINPLELNARVKALLRRSEQMAAMIQNLPAMIRHSELTLNRDNREVKINGDPVSLTSREFDLLWFFANHPNRVISRSELLDKVWGYDHRGYEHTVNSHINRLRNKLKISPTCQKHLETVWGIGYRFRVA